jgi:probable rRNA maturation factor
MNEPGDTTLAPAAADPQPDAEPRERLSVTTVAEAGGWSAFPDAESGIIAAAAALARHPRCRRAQGAEVTIVLADDALVRTLNAAYRSQDKPTNVLSFPLQAHPGTGSHALLGDVVLALETVTREAAEQGTPLLHHLQHLVVHGILHLLGFQHETDAEAEDMEAIEIEILAKLGVADPYAPAGGE